MNSNDHSDPKIAILKKAEALFLRLGIKSVSMDDVTRELGISKKTLYQYFENKEDLITQVISNHQCEEADAVTGICRGANDALEEVMGIARHVIVQLQQMSPATIFDMKKYYPEAWQVVERSQFEYVYNVVRANLERGKKEGLYRDDFDPDIIARLYVGSTAVLLDDQSFPTAEYHWSVLYREFIQYHLRGIVSPKGLKKLQEYLSEL
ncbi:MAG: TetR/AcrR family transcriptional regulator [Saprospiraceae bacterium]|nr:TetR/AcrR family transcriptional regulator [Saprospiraceae bacterium]